MVRCYTHGPSLHADSLSRIVVVDKITYSRATNTETWLTSDGRAYLVQLYEHIEHDGYSEDTTSEDVRNVTIAIIRSSQLDVISARV